MNNTEINKRGFNLIEAQEYLGVRRKAFEKYFRPHLVPIKFGTSVIFDKLDLDNLLEEYKSGNERLIEKGEVKWAENKTEFTKTAVKDGVLTKSIKATDFESVSKRLKKRKAG